MMRRSAPEAWLLLCVVALVAAPVAGSEEADWPQRWWVNGDGRTGILELSFDASGAVSGSLLDRPVSGFRTGRHLLLRLTFETRTEVWEGWLSSLATDDAGRPAEPFVAGTITVSEGAVTRVYPWFGRPEPKTGSEMRPAAELLVPTKPQGPAAEIATGPPTPPADEVRVGPAEREPVAPAGPEDSWDLSGVWLGSDGRCEIVQEGRKLTAILPDGSRHAGRLTGIDTLVVGLRRGCCNGELQGPDVIRWSDGAIWRRID